MQKVRAANSDCKGVSGSIKINPKIKVKGPSYVHKGNVRDSHKTSMVRLRLEHSRKVG